MGDALTTLVNFVAGTALGLYGPLVAIYFAILACRWIARLARRTASGAARP